MAFQVDRKPKDNQDLGGKKANRTSWAMQNDPQDENPIKKALRTWRALREIKKEAKRNILSLISPGLIVSLILAACNLGISPQPTPDLETPVPRITQIGLNIPEMSIQNYNLGGEESYPDAFAAYAEAFQGLAEKDGLDIRLLGEASWIQAVDSEKGTSVSYALMPIAIVHNLTDPDGQPANPHPVFYIAYQNEPGQMQGGYTLGNIIEQDDQGVAYVTRILDEATFRQWQTNTQSPDGSINLGQRIYRISLNPDISVGEAREIQQQLDSGKLSSADLQKKSIGVMFIQPGQEEQRVALATPEAESPSEAIIQKLLALGVSPALAAPLELSATAPEPTAEPTQSPEQAKQEFMQSAEYQKGLDDYLNAMGLEAGNVVITEETKTINGQEYEFLVATPNLVKLTQEQQKYSDVYGAVPLFMWDEESRLWSNNYYKRLANIENISLLISLPEDWYFKGNRINELSLAAENFNGVNAQGIYLLWDKPPNQRSNSYYDEHKEIFDYAKRNMMDSNIMGMHLLWGLEPVVPDWMKNLSKEELLQVFKEHVTEVVNQFPEINLWIAINEPYAIYNGGTSRELWGNKFGSNYGWIAETITIAHETNPSAAFIINQYGIEIPGTSTYIPQHFSKIIEIGQYLKDRNVPIAGIGLQGHFVASDFSDLTRAQQLMKGFRDNIKGLKEVYNKVYITELDVLIDGPSQELLQARAYQLIIKTALEEGVDVITIFGLTDRDAWKPDQTPLLFDRNLQPKPSYYSVPQAIIQ